MTGTIRFLRPLAIILISCEQDDNKDSNDNTCNVSNPAEELSWIG